MYVVHVCCVVCGCARMCHNIIVPPLQVRHIYTGPLDEEDEMAESMLTCDPEVREMRTAPGQHWGLSYSYTGLGWVVSS